MKVILVLIAVIMCSRLYVNISPAFINPTIPNTDKNTEITEQVGKKDMPEIKGTEVTEDNIFLSDLPASNMPVPDQPEGGFVASMPSMDLPEGMPEAR